MLDQVETQNSRRAFLQKAAVAGAGVAGMAAVLPSSAFAAGATQTDVDILGAAEIAEALAVTTYTNIINHAPFFKRLAADDQGYLKAARQEEMSHYLLEKGALGNKPSPFTAFYYPKHMFSNAHVTLNTLTSLEDAFIAAYLVGVRHFSTADLRVTAARIMGIESDHRTLARVLGPSVAHRDGGPVEKITGHSGRRRERRSSQQQRLRAHARAQEHQRRSRCADAVPGQDRGRQGRIRHAQGVQVPSVHPEAAEQAGRVPLLRGVSVRLSVGRWCRDVGATALQR